MTITLSALCLSLFLAAPDANTVKNVTTLKVGDTKPTLAFDDLDETRSSPSWEDLEGKVVVFDFWASWCAPCVESFPEINDLQKQFAGRGVEFFSITYEPQDHVRQFLDQHPLTTRVGLDRDFQTFKSFGAWGIPAIYIFDRQGKVVSAQHPADLSAEILQEVLAGRIPKVEQATGWEDPAGAEEYFRSLRSDLEKVPETQK